MDAKEYKERVDKLRKNYKDLGEKLDKAKTQVGQIRKTLAEMKDRKPL